MKTLAVIAAGLLVACADAPEVEAQETSPSIEVVGSFGQQLSIPRVDFSQIDACYESNCPVEELDALWASTIEFAEKEGLVDPRIDEYIRIKSQRLNVTFPEPFFRPISCKAIAAQGGLAICQTAPNARVEVGRSETDTYTQTAGPDGTLIVGFDRDEPNAFVRIEDNPEARVDFDIAKRDWDISRIDGLPSNMVSTYTDEELARIRSASARKKVGFASKVQEIGFRNGFISPIQGEYVKTTNFGAQRILNGEPKRPHFGVDLAAPKGTPIVAPADGIVSLADDDMYFEGSLIMIDHGQGLISYYLHNEEVLVEAGQHVKQGEQIATVGSRGRSTGPHLCWRLKWRGRNLDPELITRWQEEAVAQ